MRVQDNAARFTTPPRARDTRNPWSARPSWEMKLAYTGYRSPRYLLRRRGLILSQGLRDFGNPRPEPNVRGARRVARAPNQLLAQRRKIERQLDEPYVGGVLQPLAEAARHERRERRVTQQKRRGRKAFGRGDDLELEAELREMALRDRPMVGTGQAEAQMRNREKLFERELLSRVRVPRPDGADPRVLEQR